MIVGLVVALTVLIATTVNAAGQAELASVLGHHLHLNQDLGVYVLPAGTGSITRQAYSKTGIPMSRVRKMLGSRYTKARLTTGLL
jgi:hypothetical protein